MWRWITTGVLLLYMQAASAESLTAVDIIRNALEHYRGQTSASQLTMIIHRPDWQREVELSSWTEGDRRTLVRVTEPTIDAGKGTLLVDGNMWTFSPGIDRVTEIPPSTMGESWMGSDFSNRDVSKDPTIVEEYHHTLLELREQDGRQVYVIESVPQQGVGVPWGREVLHVRDDWIVLEQQFRDQDDVLVKTLQTLEIGEVSGRTFAKVMRMGITSAPDEWTEVRTNAIEFDTDLPTNMFTLSNLRTPGE